MTNLQAGILHAFGMVLITLNQLALADYSNGTSEQSKNPALIPALAQSTYSNPGKTVSSLFDGLINMTDSNQSSGDTNLKSLSSPLIASGSRGSQSEASSYSDISQAQKHESNSVSATQSPQILPPKAHAIGQMKPALLDATRTLDLTKTPPALRTRQIFATESSTNSLARVLADNVDQSGETKRQDANAVLPGQDNRIPPTKGIQRLTNTASTSSLRHLALVFGNGNYRHIARLPNPEHDANDVCQALRAVQFEVTCIIDVRSRREFREAIHSFKSKLDPRSVAFFYYAGHGVQVHAENYLLPISVDARSEADIEEDGLSLSYLLRTLEEARSSPNIVVLDACRENPFPNLASEGVWNGLTRIDPPIGTMLVYATAPDGVALDGTGRNGLFAKHFIEHLADPGQTIDGLFQVVAKDVEDEAMKYGIRQVPFRSSSYSSTFCFAGCENPKVLAELEQVKQQWEEADKKARDLTDEISILRNESNERVNKIAELNAKIAALASSAASTNNQHANAVAELAHLRATLDAVRSEEAQEAEKQTRATRERETEIAELREQMTDLQKKAQELNNYRQKMQLLQDQNNDAAMRMKALAEENADLKQQAELRQANIASLEAEIKRISRKTPSNETLSPEGQAELDRLQTALARERAAEKDAEHLQATVLDREAQILTLKKEMERLQRQAQQLEEYRKQISVLQEENSEKGRQLREIRTPATPVFSPSF